VLRIGPRIALLAATILFLSVAATSAAVPKDPCAVLTRTQVRRLLLGHRVVRVRHRENPKNRAVECTWVTGFFQTPRLRRIHAAFSLRLTVQPTATAASALDTLRARVGNPTNETTVTIPHLGDEAYSNLGDAIVVSGDVVFQVAVNNYDSSVRPFPRVDAMARRAGVLVVEQLARSQPAGPGARPA
jgi:hypothetical protein